MSIVRIGNAHGFWGDRIEAAAEMLAREPDLDYLTLDFLAEVSLGILAQQKVHKQSAGYPRDFLDVVAALLPYWRAGGRCRIITNAGGLDPLACGLACQELLAQGGCADRTVAAISGDDVLPLIRGAAAGSQDAALFCHLETGQPIERIASQLVTANAYLGARSAAEALLSGADVVIAGRLADPSLTVAACAAHFGWSWDDWDRLAGATVAGHLIECGAQVTGGISTDWLQLPDVHDLGFPIVEVDEDGSCVVTKPRGTGGRVDLQTVKEQLVYEIADPNAYVSPDVIVSFLTLQLRVEGPDRVRVWGATGRSQPATYKVCGTYQDGYRAQGQLVVVGREAVRKARRAAEAVFARLRQNGVLLRETRIECLGAGDCWPRRAADSEPLLEIVLRVAAADDSRETLQRFARELMPLVTAGPQGTTGYAEGRPKVHPLFRLWPCLVDRQRVTPRFQLLGSGPARTRAPSVQQRDPLVARTPGPLAIPSPPVRESPRSATSASWVRLGEVAYARSGDKGTSANIGVVSREAADFPWLCGELTPEAVARYLNLDDHARVERFELANLAALNFVVHGILDSPLRADAQGKALGQVLLEMPLERSQY